MELSINQKSNNKTKLAIGIFAVLTLISGVLIGKFYFGNQPQSNNFTTISDKQESQQKISDDRQTAITRAIGKVENAIVGINVEEVREVRNPFFDDPFFRQFFGNQGNQKQVVRGLGSGFIISPDGYIITNDHVAGNATKISVTLTTGETVQAQLIGNDPTTDIALLKIDKSNLPYIPFGNSDNILIGEWVIALGNPFGLFEINDKPTVTVGVVSATDMKVQADGNRVYKNMIQTDASINSGNSGGPLIDTDGNVIGMNTIIYTGGQFNSGSIGVGFSISINRVKKIVDELKSKGKIERNFNVGFNIQGIDENIAKYLGLKDNNGVVVTQVLRGSLSDKAGLKVEDVILEVNGVKIRNQQDIVYEINDLRVGDKVTMKILRNNSEDKIEMTLEPTN
ncbi:MAG TPA: trypsin-like peptidase domain-containing protein [Ignavibacteria bacterium]|nr:trypsin-like peptidase domain-containing protein [Ignavibacteria bacterium]